MSLKYFFTETITQLESIQVDKPKVIPKANNFAKTPSNNNQFFKTVNIWDEQIDDLIKGDGYEMNMPSIFIEYIIGDAKQLLNKVKSYPDSVITFHIFSMSLNQQGTDKMEQNLDIYDLRDKVVSKITGWSPTRCSGFMNCQDKIDYKHKNITKYLLSYNFNFIDLKGSIYDIDSQNYLKQLILTNPTISSSIFFPWISGGNYVSNVSVVILNKLVYLCKNDNTDIVFTIDNWVLITEWKSKNQYLINDYCFNFGIIFRCITGNSDAVFDQNNWNKIT